MNWPNRLSIIRVLCIPIIILLLYLPSVPARWAAVFFFAFASFTDYLDGHLARKYQLITNFGKFIDPVADKLLVLSTFIMLIEKGWFPAWAVVVILARELCIDGLRLIAMTKQKVIAAGKLGKIKTASQMGLILLLMVLRKPVFSSWISAAAAAWVIGITLWSAVDYFLKNRSVFRDS
jgi:CDP-diacylglycerol--glycerol-3-phosphate 3-phosphatidyltransferase